jgi:hypothetical protein
MKYNDLHTWENLKPDEKEYKESIIEFLCDHFCHEDIQIIFTHDTNSLPIYGKNVITFLILDSTVSVLMTNGSY